MNFLNCLFCNKDKDKEKEEKPMHALATNNTKIGLKQFSIIATTRDQYSLKLQINKLWSQKCKLTAKKQLQQYINDLLIKKVGLESWLIITIINWATKITSFIKKKHFIANISIVQIIQPGRKQQKKLIQIQEFFYLSLEKRTKQNVRVQLEQIKQAISQQYNFFNEIPQQINLAYNQIQKLFSLVSIKDNQQINGMKQRILLLFQHLLKRVMINNYLFAIRYILTKLKDMSHGKYYYQIQKQWMKYQKEIKDTQCLQNLIAKFKQYQIVNSASLSNSDHNYDNSPNKLKSNRLHSFRQRSSDSSNKSSIQQNKSQEYRQSQSKIVNQQKEKLIKFYQTKITAINECAKIQIFLQYISFHGQRQQKMYQLQSLLKQNQMNVYRYCQSLSTQYNMKFKIKIDNHNENLPLLSHFQRQSKCFQIQIQKGDKGYSKFYTRRQRQNIFRQDIWDFRSRKLIYSFLKSFALGIQQLQNHYLHHVDFQFENFIKFGNLFKIIDYGSVFFVKNSYRSSQYFDFNRKIFDCWLKCSTGIEQLRKLTSTFGNYQTIKQNDSQGEDVAGNENKIDRCLAIMQDHMKMNHYNQFYLLSKALVSQDGLNYQGFSLSRDEIKHILSITPQNRYTTNFSYENYVERLQDIFQRYHQDRENRTNNTPIDLIGKQYSLISSYLQGFNANIRNTFMRKILKTIQLMHYRPFKFICHYHFEQTIQKQGGGDVWLYTKDNHVRFTQNIFQRERYIILFLKSCIQLLEELEFRGFLILHLNIDLFVQNGEKFILKNLAFLFKIRRSQDQDQNLGQGLIKTSVRAFAKLLINNNTFRTEIFPAGLLNTLCTQLFQESNNERNDQRNHERNNRIIADILLRQMKSIHFSQFKTIINYILSNAPPTFRIIDKIKESMNKKNMMNYFSLYEQLDEIINQSY